MELAALVVLALGATLADGAEVLSSLGDDVVEENEVDASSLGYGGVSKYSLQLKTEVKGGAGALKLQQCRRRGRKTHASGWTRSWLQCQRHQLRPRDRSTRNRRSTWYGLPWLMK